MTTDYTVVVVDVDRTMVVESGRAGPPGPPGTGGGGGGGAVAVQEGDVTKVAVASTLDFLGADFDVTEAPVGEANIVLASSIARQADIAAEAATRAAADTAETNARIAADTAEATARANADTAETTARTNGDNGLDARLDVLEAAPPPAGLVPTGGATGTVLRKTAATNYATGWSQFSENTAGDLAFANGVPGAGGTFAGGVLRNVSGVVVENAYTQTVDPVDDAFGVAYGAFYETTLNYAGPAMVGPTASSSVYYDAGSGTAWGKRGTFNLEGHVRFQTSQSIFAYTPHLAGDSLIVTNTPGTALTLTPGWGVFLARTNVADGATVTQIQPDGSHGGVGYADWSMYMSENGGLWDGMANNSGHTSFLSNPFFLGNCNMRTRVGFDVHDVNFYAPGGSPADMGDSVKTVVKMGINSDPTNPTLTDNIAFRVRDMTLGTNRLSFLSEGAAVQLRHVGPAVFGANAAPTFGARVRFAGTFTQTIAGADVSYIHMDPQLNVSGTGNVANAFNMIPNYTLTGATGGINAVKLQVGVDAASARTVTTVMGVQGTAAIGANVTGTTVTASQATALTVDATATITTGIAADLAVSKLFSLGTIGTGVILRGLTNDATTKWSMQFGDFQSYHVGKMTLGATAAPVYALDLKGTAQDRGVLALTETAATPTNPTSSAQTLIYMKADKLVFAFNHAGTMRYFTIDLTQSGATATVAQSTTAP